MHVNLAHNSFANDFRRYLDAKFEGDGDGLLDASARFFWLAAWGPHLANFSQEAVGIGDIYQERRVCYLLNSLVAKMVRYKLEIGEHL